MSYVLEHNLFNSHYLLFEVKKTKHITLVSGQDICQYHTSIRVGYLSVSHQYQSRISGQDICQYHTSIRAGYLSVSHQYQSRISGQDICQYHTGTKYLLNRYCQKYISGINFRMLEQNSMQQWSTINKLLCFIYHI